MIVNVRLFAVLLILLVTPIVVTVRQRVVVVLVAMPVCAMLPLAHRPAPVMMRHMVVVVLVCARLVCVRGHLALAYRVLPDARTPLPDRLRRTRRTNAQLRELEPYSRQRPFSTR